MLVVDEEEEEVDPDTLPSAEPRCCGCIVDGPRGATELTREFMVAEDELPPVRW